MDEGRPDARAQNLLGFLAGELLNYKEEGVELTPSIVLCDSLRGFLEVFPGPVSHTIGTAPMEHSSGPRILKDCGPLSSRNWFIFIECADNVHANYGVFTYFRLPTAIPLPEGITINPDQFCILVRRIGPNTIEMRGAKGSILTMIFSTTRESSTAEAPIGEFAVACCAKIMNDVSGGEFKTYFARVLDASLTSSHGTILVCAEDLDLPTIPEMQDAVPVLPMLDFHAAFAEYQTAGSAGSILNLQRCEELLQGLLRCDGLVVFDTIGRVTAYRVFFRPTSKPGGEQAVVGGARLRAYEGLKPLVGKQLVSVLFRSQDGLTLHHGVNQ
jgi:hypothetical protein